jgi:uncharacterized protein (DUF58 family)
MRQPARLEPRRRYHFHLPGLLYIIVTVFLALGAFNSQNNLLFWSLGLAFGGLIISGIVSGTALMGLQVERQSVAAAGDGDELVIRYVIVNRSRVIPALALHLEESTERHPYSPDATWQGHMDRPCALVLHVGPRERVVASAIVRPKHRGEVRFTSIRVWTTFPFGITRKSMTFFERGTAIVRPRQVALRPSLIESIRGRIDVGVEREAQPGEGDEFFGLREYVIGDSPRSVAWRPSARLGQLVVRTNIAPTPRRIWIVLRLARQGEEELEERAISVTASLVSMAIRQGNAVGLSIPRAGVVMSPRSGARHTERMLNELGRLDLEAIRQAGRPDRMPASAAHSGGCLVVHAGALDPTWGSRRARHISVRSMQSLLADDLDDRSNSPARHDAVGADTLGVV